MFFAAGDGEELPSPGDRLLRSNRDTTEEGAVGGCRPEKFWPEKLRPTTHHAETADQPEILERNSNFRSSELGDERWLQFIDNNDGARGGGVRNPHEDKSPEDFKVLKRVCHSANRAPGWKWRESVLRNSAGEFDHL